MSNAKKNLRKAKRMAREEQQRKRATKILFGALLLLLLVSLIAFRFIGNGN